MSKSRNTTNPRALAARLLVHVIDGGQSLSTALPVTFKKLDDLNQRGLVQELCYGSLRWHLRLNALADALLRHPFKSKDRDIHFVILLGLYQLIYLDKPAHAVVNETVKASIALGKPWAKGVVNAVLRNAQRQLDDLAKKIDADVAVATSHPAWLLRQLQSDWPDHWQAITAANNQRPPMTLRVNQRLVSVAAYCQQLRETGLSADRVPGSPDALVLTEAVSVESLPGFERGFVSVQDAAAQLAAHLLDAQPGDRILDACAAPGGKTCHLLERQPQLAELIAIDIEAERLKRVEENLQRLGLEANLVAADAADIQSWWDGNYFDRILLDAPCSATGVIRRHPDIKTLRRASDISALAVTQQHLLEAMWEILAPGGLLLYATCSVLLRENIEQLQTFMSEHSDCSTAPLSIQPGHKMAIGHQLLPGEGGMDGFYYAALIKARATQ
ncbi:MAG: 16S rRNA (cytosine(967)-C(5))-methyltransferase RsmB [Gammaproteobacteria bacterium]